MGDILHRPFLIAIEIAWRWIFGIPFLLICARQGQHILAQFPLESSGFNSIDTQNPWIAATQIVHVWIYYEPPVAAVVRWLLPPAALAWVAISGLGRAFLLRGLNTAASARRPLRIFAIMTLQAVWLVLLALTLWGWYRSIQWAATTHLTVEGDPDLLGFAIWAIFLTLTFFTAWALVSWTATIAQFLALLEKRSALSALVQTLRLGKTFASKLAEINLVLGIVKLALIVLAMVFSAAPLPFSDELSDALPVVWAASMIFYLVANDYFQVIRLKAFLEFWRVYRKKCDH
jgi:hypothetical protein